jgi:broad specificity phosphatase PhoE
MGLTAERVVDFERRIGEALDRMIIEYPGGRILVVTHWVVLSQMKRALIDGGDESLWSYGPWEACGLTEFKQSAASWEVGLFDDATHLEKLEG